MPISEVYNMDCMEYMKDIPDKFFDLAIVDPPYGINAPNMTMGTNLNRKHGGYNGESVAQRLKKGRLNQGAGKLKDRALIVSLVFDQSLHTCPVSEYQPF